MSENDEDVLSFSVEDDASVEDVPKVVEEIENIQKVDESLINVVEEIDNTSKVVEEIENIPKVVESLAKVEEFVSKQVEESENEKHEKQVKHEKQEKHVKHVKHEKQHRSIVEGLESLKKRPKVLAKTDTIEIEKGVFDDFSDDVIDDDIIDKVIDFGSGIEVDVQPINDASILPDDRTIDVWLKECGLVMNDRRPGFPPIPRQESSVKASKFFSALEAAELISADKKETKRDRRIWDAYIVMRDDYYHHGGNITGNMTTGGTTNFSGFFDDEAEEIEEVEEVEETGKKKRKQTTTRGPGQMSMTNFYNRSRNKGVQVRPNEYDYDDGFVVHDNETVDEVETVSKKPPSEMTATELLKYASGKRRVLRKEMDKLSIEEEELCALQNAIEKRKNKIKQLDEMVMHCSDLASKGKQEEEV